MRFGFVLILPHLAFTSNVLRFPLNTNEFDLYQISANISGLSYSLRLGSECVSLLPRAAVSRHGLPIISMQPLGSEQPILMMERISPLSRPLPLDIEQRLLSEYVCEEAPANMTSTQPGAWLLAIGQDSQILSRHRSAATIRTVSDNDREGAILVLGDTLGSFHVSCVPGTIVDNIPMRGLRARYSLSFGEEDPNDGILSTTRQAPQSVPFHMFSFAPGRLMSIPLGAGRIVAELLTNTGSSHIRGNGDIQFTNCNMRILPSLDIEIIGHTTIRLYPEDYLYVLPNGNCVIPRAQSQYHPADIAIDILNLPHTNVRLNQDGTYSLCESRV